MKEDKYMVCCPRCGYQLFQSTLAKSDVKCYKCRAEVHVWLMNGELKIRASEPEIVK